MTRFRLQTGPAALFGAVFVIALIVLLPLRLVLGGFDLGTARIAAREATGSVWSGGLREAEVGTVALGDLDAGLSPWSLLVGRARLDIAARSDAADLHGAISASRHSVGLDAMTARLATGGAFGPLPIAGLDLDAVSVRFVGDLCDAAEGRVTARLDGAIDLGPALSGTVRCDAGALLLPLASQAGTERIALRLRGDGRFQADLTVRPIDPAAAQQLEARGFRPSPSGERLAFDGKF